MTTTGFIESVSPMLAVLTPLVAVPLTIITFYLRSLREQQVSWHADLVHRIDAVETSLRELRKTIDEFERDYTTKEEWLRECMLARRTLEQLSETATRLDTTIHAMPTTCRTAAGGLPHRAESIGSDQRKDGE